MRFRTLVSLAGFILLILSGFLVSCGKKTFEENILVDLCLNYCEKLYECDLSGEYTREKRDACQESCDLEDFTRPEVFLSETLVPCGKYTECPPFAACVEQGGTLVDDQYGGYSGQ